MGSRAIEFILAQQGGAVTRAQLRRVASHRQLRRAVAEDRVVRVARGRYCTPQLATHQRVAHELSAVLSHTSAAVHLGWSLKHEPAQPWLTVRPNRHLTTQQRSRARISWRRLPPEEVRGYVTAPLRTVVDCARALPPDEALAIADSACRTGDVDAADLAAAAADLRGRGSQLARRVLCMADGRAANPMESVLRWIAAQVPGLTVLPQVEISEPDIWAMVDLADRTLRIVVEAEGFEHHGTRRGFDKDCERYTTLTCHGWLVLRFTWTQIMFRPGWVQDRMAEAVALRTDGEESSRLSAPEMWESWGRGERHTA